MNEVCAVTFRRQNFNTDPPIEEEVAVIFAPTVPYDDDHIERFDDEMWAALWEQYPVWRCPYSQSNRAPNALEAWRHGFSSPHPSQNIRLLGAAR